jgi:hypothetical protein
MYSPQLLRVHHDEWLRHAETRRLIKQAAVSGRNVATGSGGSVLGRLAMALRPRNAVPTSTPAP